MKTYFQLYFIIIFIFLFASCKQSNIKDNHFQITSQIQKSISADTAIVASARKEASMIALDIMKSGGNAVDAAIATQFALAVCYPVAGNIGGGGFMMIRTKEGNIDALDFREKAPLKSFKDLYLDENGEVIPNKSTTGSLAVGVPGTVDGMVKAFEKYSALKNWKQLIQPSIDMAYSGFEITAKQAKLLNEKKGLFTKYNTMPNEFNTSKVWESGDTLIQNDLAKCLERIRDKGRSGFYQGETANLIVEEMDRSNGLISHEDLDKYQSVWRTPITTEYRDYKIISMPPPSSGGIALVQLLKMVEPYSISTSSHHSAENIHLIVEAERRVYADRSKHIGDSDFYPVPQSTLMDKDYLINRMADFDIKHASKSENIIASDINESTETTHYSIVDKDGNSISVTTTINGHYGSKVVVGNGGFFLNNEMDDFSAKPGTPNMFGLIGAEANKIEPEKRMLSSMTPTIVEKDNDFFMSLGTPGGSTIITSVFQTILNVIDHNMTIEDAVNTKRFHHQWKPDIIYIEEGLLSDQTKSILTLMGHTIKERDPIGRVEAILYKNGKYFGAADIRGDDDVRGY